MQSLYLKPKEHHRIRKGHLWIFSNELETIPRDLAAGDTVKLYTHDRHFIGTGIFNPHSLISVRLISTRDEEPDATFFKRRLSEAHAMRTAIYDPAVTDAWRLIHGESDGLPGLVIDRFANAMVIQSYTAGMDRHLPLITDALQELYNPDAIILRNSSPLRELEGLSRYDDIIKGEPANAIQRIHDNGLTYEVDLFKGQKTGFFLDQRQNRAIIRTFARNARVLDVFANDGGFALNALHAGASSAILIDASRETLERADTNARLNGFSNYSLVAEDAFDTLETMHANNEQFDLIILDPPSFTKSRKNLPGAIKAYKRLNRLGMKLLRNGGFLATASCSHHLCEEEFLDIIRQSAITENTRIRLIHKAAQPFDHPILLAMPETRYLKFACFYCTR